MALVLLLGALAVTPAAFADLSKAIDLETTNAHYYQMRGQIQNKLEKDAPALADFEMAIELEPDNLNRRGWRAVTLFNLGNLELRESSEEEERFRY